MGQDVCVGLFARQMRQRWRRDGEEEVEEESS